MANVTPVIGTPTPSENQSILAAINSANLLSLAQSILSPGYTLNATNKNFQKVTDGDQTNYIAIYPIDGEVEAPSQFAALLDSSFNVTTWSVVLSTPAPDNQVHVKLIKDGKVTLDKDYGTTTKNAVITEAQEPPGSGGSSPGYFSRLSDCLSNLGVTGTALSIFQDVCEPICIASVTTLGAACVDCGIVNAAIPAAEITYCAAYAI
ncbi:hypothetical protein [Alicyclobacillus suci]|uniref:hypothetical protein n=1 Tax=Alicyclobacillus suci TaxID=2816080 RepID=UPI001A8F8CEA|nr:hypothetical protein [Alicyclobacillus suci]